MCNFTTTKSEIIVQSLIIMAQSIPSVHIPTD